MTFQIDTSGEISTDYNPLTKWRWSDLDAFTQGYIEALFASIPAVAHGVGFRERGYREASFSDLAPETLARIIADCERYARGFALRNTDEGKREQGPQLWDFRQGCHLPGFPPLIVQLGDGGKVRFSA